MTFHVGQLVVCVDNRNSPPNSTAWLPGEGLVEGQIYTIASIHLWEGHEVFWLHEVKRHPLSVKHHGKKCGYGYWRFRPVKTTSIDVFTALLAPTDMVQS